MESVPIGLRVGEKQLVEQMGFEKEEGKKKKYPVYIYVAIFSEMMKDTPSFVSLRIFRTIHCNKHMITKTDRLNILH